MKTKNNISDLKTKGFVSVKYPENLRDAVSKTIESWKKFCSLPEEIKKGLPYSNSADGVGYELKDGKGPKADRKENFDVTIAGKNWLKNNLGKIGKIGNKKAAAFAEDATSLVGIMKPLILQFASDVEKKFGIRDFKKEVEASEDAFFVRFIHYFGDRKLEEETATAHFDQSGFTLHLFESAEGLQCLDLSKKWINMPVSEGETVIIPSAQLQLRSKGKLTALFHRVITTPETAQTGRFSAVCFVQLKKTPKYDKEKWGRIQELAEKWGPGFSYGMKHNEFSKFFK